jgi:hypothetical protein
MLGPMERTPLIQIKPLAGAAPKLPLEVSETLQPQQGRDLNRSTRVVPQGEME